jgi:hypothetical protein
LSVIVCRQIRRSFRKGSTARRNETGGPSRLGAPWGEGTGKRFPPPTNRPRGRADEENHHAA